nr:hypothetical protein [uncultured Brevundimonas sp.]
MARHLKRGEVGIREVPFTKADFLGVPEEDRALFFMAAQTANELAMLRSIILQALDAAHGDKVLGETGLAMAFFGARQLAGTVTEGWEKLFRSEGKDQQFQKLWDQLPGDIQKEAMQTDVAEARGVLNEAFADDKSFLRRVRNKLAFHLDRPAIIGAFNLLPDDITLNDFHTGHRGSTFYGGADTIMAVAASHLLGSDDLAEGMNEVVEQANRVGGALETLIDAYLVAFVIHYFGRARLQVDERIVRFMAEGTRSRVRFYFDQSRIRRDTSRR